MELWAGKVFECLILSELVCGNLEDTAKRTEDDGGLACDYRQCLYDPLGY